MSGHSAQKCPCKLSLKKQIQTFLPRLKKISNAKTLSAKKKLFREAPACFTKFVSHCASAILRGDIELPARTYAQLKKYKKLLLDLSDEKIRLESKIGKFLNKRGGAFPLLPILARVLTNVVVPFIIDKIKND